MKMRAKMISVGLLGTAALLPLDIAKADQVGHASWYSLPANITASGERMDPNELTAAHRSLPFGTRVLVENLTNGRSVVVRINDRGPFVGGRIIDLSKAAAESIGMLGAGTAQVRITTTVPDGGNALADLGEATLKAEKGVALAAKASAGTTPRAALKTVTTARLEGKGRRPQTETTELAALSQAKAKTRVAAASIKTTRHTVGHSAQAGIAVAWEPPRYSRKMARIAARSTRLTHVATAYSYKSGVVRGSARGRAVAKGHPYAVFAAVPGLTRPAS